jgi:hypothetical protein
MDSTFIPFKLREFEGTVNFIENLNISVYHGNRSWEGTFSRSSIEKTTKKLGSFKSFEVFQKMIIAALLKTSKDVSFDILNSIEFTPLKPTLKKHPSETLIFILNYFPHFETQKFPLILKLVHSPIPPDNDLEKELTFLINYNSQKTLKISQLEETLEEKIETSRKISLEIFKLKQELDSLSNQISSLTIQVSSHSKRTSNQKQFINHCHSSILSSLSSKLENQQKTLSELLQERSIQSSRITQLETQISQYFRNFPKKTPFLNSYFSKDFHSLSLSQSLRRFPSKTTFNLKNE